MSDASVLWAEPPEEDRDEADDIEAHGAVDESFPVRRLHRWIAGMFGGRPADEPEPPERQPGP